MAASKCMNDVALEHLLEPPTHPQEVPSEAQLKASETVLGIPLPTDYKKFLVRYGTGKIFDFLLVYNPVSVNPFANLFARTLMSYAGMRYSRREFQKLGVNNQFPEPGGLLPWGATDNGDTLCWLTEGLPNNWPVVVCESRGEDQETFPDGFASFLTGWISGQHRVSVFSAMSGPATFVPSRTFV